MVVAAGHGSNRAIGPNAGIVSEAHHYESMDHKQSMQTQRCAAERRKREILL